MLAPETTGRPPKRGSCPVSLALPLRRAARRGNLARGKGGFNPADPAASGFGHRCNARQGAGHSCVCAEWLEGRAIPAITGVTGLSVTHKGR